MAGMKDPLLDRGILHGEGDPSLGKSLARLSFRDIWVPEVDSSFLAQGMIPGFPSQEGPGVGYTTSGSVLATAFCTVKGILHYSKASYLGFLIIQDDRRNCVEVGGGAETEVPKTAHVLLRLIFLPFSGSDLTHTGSG